MRKPDEISSTDASISLSHDAALYKVPLEMVYSNLQF